jgi:2-oxoglutarate ferredoxin oxidoreductase subunit alpha
MDYSIKIGGEAGQGVQTIGDALGRVFCRAGLHVFTHQDYESRIRGGHNFYQIRLSDRPVSASKARIDILVALDRESIRQHEQELAPHGHIIYDSAALRETHDRPSFLDIPFTDLAIRHGGDKIMANTVATGAVLGLLGMDLSLLLDLITAAFARKGEKIVAANRNAAMAGHDSALQGCGRCSFSLRLDGASRPRMLLGGVEAIALGALSSGCKFYSAYPMTPSTGIMNYLAGKEKEYGIVVEQAEDEIAAINMALGASFAGARAMTGTSGGGFSLMVEGLSLAAMTETPVVIAMGQRPGPATGFATRTEQGELQFLLSAGHGEFPRLIFAPGSPEQAFRLTNKAFDLAEKYQVPAFILYDTYLADSQWTYRGLDLSGITHTDYRLRGEAFARLDSYKRHAFTDSGVTPLAVPGDAKHVVVTDSDEHDEEGHIVEDALTRVKMVEKRLLRKLPQIKREIAPPFLYGTHNPDVLIAGWGSTYGVMREAVDELAKSHDIAMLHFSELFPFPSSSPSPLAGEGGVRGRYDYLSLLSSAKATVCIEHNATGQFARLMRAETGFEFGAHVRKFDGRPFVVEELVREISAKCKMKNAK